RGFAQQLRIAPPSAGPPEGSVPYDAATCARFLDPDHIGDSVLERSKIFFEALERDGEIMSLELVAALGLKGARSIPANLTIPLKKSAWRLDLEQPWHATETPDGSRTI